MIDADWTVTCTHARAVVTAFPKFYPFHFEMDRIGLFGSLYCTKGMWPRCPVQPSPSN